MMQSASEAKRIGDMKTSPDETMRRSMALNIQDAQDAACKLEKSLDKLEALPDKLKYKTRYLIVLTRLGQMEAIHKVSQESRSPILGTVDTRKFEQIEQISSKYDQELEQYKILSSQLEKQETQDKIKILSQLEEVEKRMNQYIKAETDVRFEQSQERSATFSSLKEDSKKIDKFLSQRPDPFNPNEKLTDLIEDYQARSKQFEDLREQIQQMSATKKMSSDGRIYANMILRNKLEEIEILANKINIKRVWLVVCEQRKGSSTLEQAASSAESEVGKVVGNPVKGFRKLTEQEIAIALGRRWQRDNHLSDLTQELQELQELQGREGE